MTDDTTTENIYHLRAFNNGSTLHLTYVLCKRFIFSKGINNEIVKTTWYTFIATYIRTYFTRKRYKDIYPSVFTTRNSDKFCGPLGKYYEPKS